MAPPTHKKKGKEPKDQTPAVPKSTPAKKETKPGVMYLGPNIPGGALMHAQIFRGGLPEAVKDLNEKHPPLKELLIPLKDVPQAKLKLADSGSDISRDYEALSRALLEVKS